MEGSSRRGMNMKNLRTPMDVSALSGDGDLFLAAVNTLTGANTAR